jgi:hypothetical protein
VYAALALEADRSRRTRATQQTVANRLLTTRQNVGSIMRKPLMRSLIVTPETPNGPSARRAVIVRQLSPVTDWYARIPESLIHPELWLEKVLTDTLAGPRFRTQRRWSHLAVGARVLLAAPDGDGWRLPDLSDLNPRVRKAGLTYLSVIGVDIQRGRSTYVRILSRRSSTGHGSAFVDDRLPDIGSASTGHHADAFYRTSGVRLPDIGSASTGHLTDEDLLLGERYQRQGDVSLQRGVCETNTKRAIDPHQKRGGRRSFGE